MRNNWLSYSLAERKVMLQEVSRKEHIPDYAVEKDWWVSMVLKALFQVECADYLLFKGGTSLSKGWRLVERFSEDIDISLSHTFFGMSIDNNNQLKNLRKKSRRYIIETLAPQLKQALANIGLADLQVEPLIEVDGVVVSTDADPTVINVNYQSIADSHSDYVPTKVKIEISCLSMDVPFERKHITTLISDMFPDADLDTDCTIPTVVPSRTFLEKAFLLNEEFQKATPRSLRMSRHLYDLEKLMDTQFAADALTDKELYHMIVEHRRKFYHVGYADYDKDYPHAIHFIPSDNIIKEWQEDYRELVKSFVYGSHLEFGELIARLQTLQQRFREIGE